MEHFVHSLKLLWRSERMLKQNEVRLRAKQVQIHALAGLVAVIGLVMLSLAAFFALVPYWGQARAALAVGGIDLAVALALVVFARSLKPAAEAEMVKEMRDLALTDIQEEVAQFEAELLALRDDIHGFVHDPVGTVLPKAVGPLLEAVTRGLRSRNK